LRIIKRLRRIQHRFLRRIPAGVALLSFLALRAGIALLPLLALCAGIAFLSFLSLCAGLSPKRRFLLIRQAFKSHLAVLALRSLRAGGSGLAPRPLRPDCARFTLRPLRAGRACFALRPPLAGVAFFAPRPLRASVAFFAFRALRADKFPVVELLLHVVCNLLRTARSGNGLSGSRVRCACRRLTSVKLRQQLGKRRNHLFLVDDRVRAVLHHPYHAAVKRDLRLPVLVHQRQDNRHVAPLCVTGLRQRHRYHVGLHTAHLLLQACASRQDHAQPRLHPGQIGGLAAVQNHDHKIVRLTARKRRQRPQPFHRRRILLQIDCAANLPSVHLLLLNTVCPSGRI